MKAHCTSSHQYTLRTEKLIVTSIMHGTIPMEMSENKGVFWLFRTFKVKIQISAGVQWMWESSKRSSALLTALARRSLKDYTVDCQRGVQSSGLRNQRIRAQGLGVLCPTHDKTATQPLRRDAFAPRDAGSRSPLYLLCRFHVKVSVTSRENNGTIMRWPSF